MVVVTRLNRLASSARDLLDVAEQLCCAKAGLRLLVEPWVDTTSPTGCMVLSVFAGIAEFERSLILSRTSAGKQAAVQRGVRFGRRPKLDADQLALAWRLMEKGMSVCAAARMLNVHVATLYRGFAALPVDARIEPSNHGSQPSGRVHAGSCSTASRTR